MNSAVAAGERTPPPWRADLALALVAMVWGGTFVLVKDALTDVSPVLFLGLRFSAATIALGVLYVLNPSGRGAYGAWTGGIVTGALLYLGYLLQTLGLQLTTPAKSGFITGLSIVLVPLASSIVYKKAPQLSEVLGVAIATTGLGLMTLTGRTLEMGKGDLLTVGCAVVFTFHIMVLGYYSRRMAFEWLTLLQIGTCAAIGLGSFWWVETPVLHWNRQVFIAIAVTSLLATALAFTVQTWAQRYTTPTRTALIFALEPVFAWATSFVLTNEVLSRRAAIGALLILAGILLVELKPITLRQHQNK
jgi:drug/metabolite transporter (DMT)-like permease